MSRRLFFSARAMALVLAGVALAGAPRLGATEAWQVARDRLVLRLRALSAKDGAFGPAFAPLYRAALPWYEQWGGRSEHSVDSWMMPPDQYAAELADALEHGRNFIAENPGSLFPLCFAATLPGGHKVSANYWISLPADFGKPGARFPLIITLPGSGWLSHPLSFARNRKPSALYFEVTPINQAGPWRIDFLNALLDRLLKMLPVDPDRVYVRGHSLGGMAAWEWALDNPERFAAISPRAAIGEPFRAARLRRVPAWVVHGEEDDIVPRGFDEEMISALRRCGVPVVYTVLKGAKHNLPADFDERPIIEWFLRQTRSHIPPPPDPRDNLGIGPGGFSSWDLISRPARRGWVSPAIPGLAEDDRFDSKTNEQLRPLEKALFDKIHAQGGIVGTPIRRICDVQRRTTELWLAEPVDLRSKAAASAEPDATALPPARYIRFYFRGSTAKAFEHAREIRSAAAAKGYRLSSTIWVTPLTLWHDAPDYIAEYWVELDDRPHQRK